MKYNFSFERKRLLLLLAGQLLVGILIFVAGMVTGIALWVPARNEIALLKGQTSAPTTLAAAKITLPAVPALPAQQPLPASHPPAEAAAAPPAPPLAENAVAEKAAPAASAPAVPAAEPVPVRAILSPEAAGAFCLQLGSFEKAENARKLQSDLKDKGIIAIIFDQTDASQRTWHAVRVGGFNSLDAASQAAADFSSKWRIQAMVRRSDSL